ncbi:MAG: hypothetical protein AMXMBFR83_02650 [Phycisphaerae bacterium]
MITDTVQDVSSRRYPDFGPDVETAEEAQGRSALAGEPRPVVYLLGRRIYFRPLELEDEPLLRRWLNDPRVRVRLCHRPPVTATRERAYLEELGQDRTHYAFGIVVKANDALIGSAGLRNIDPISRSATFGILIGDLASQGRGYGTEATRLMLKFAFQELNLNRVELAVIGSNWRAIRVYQKCGFVPEGCLRQAVFRDGQYEDEYRFAVLREEWRP